MRSNSVPFISIFPVFRNPQEVEETDAPNTSAQGVKNPTQAENRTTQSATRAAKIQPTKKAGTSPTYFSAAPKRIQPTTLTANG